MVGHLVAAAAKRAPLRYIHVNLLLSRNEQDVGSMRPAKLFLLAVTALKALRACLFGGARDVYYVPAPGKKGAVIRDVLLLSLIKPFTRRLYLHWHSVGLGQYLEENSSGPWNRRLRGLLEGHHMSLCLTAGAASDAEKLKPRQIKIIPNGIPDPCGNYADILAARHSRLLTRGIAMRGETTQPVSVQLLFLGLCTRSKGIFSALKIAADLSAILARNSGTCQVTLIVAGPFREPAEEEEFKSAIVNTLQGLSANSKDCLKVELAGFTTGEQKKKLLEQSDLFVFPTIYENEGLPLTLLEALAFGLPVLSTRWRGIPDIFDSDYPFLIEPAAAADSAHIAMAALEFKDFEGLRRRFVEQFELSIHLERIFEALETE